MDQKYTFEQFCGIIRELRGENGCPWDKVQTHESLIPCMIEEAYEAVDGIKTLQEGKGWDSLCEELGDVLMQVIFHSQLAEEEGYFTFEDVVDGISRKMIHRHPHVFGGHTEEKPDWDALKREEHSRQTPEEEIAAVPQALPALIRSSKVLKKMDKYYGYGSDADETLQELKQKVVQLEKEQGIPESGETVGDMLLLLCNYARLKGFNSELLLGKSLEKCLKSYEIK